MIFELNQAPFKLKKCILHVLYRLNFLSANFSVSYCIFLSSFQTLAIYNQFLKIRGQLEIHNLES